MNRKEKILLAMNVVLLEYREKTHIATIGSCALCQQFYTTERSADRHQCHKCPMFIFNGDGDLSCLKRKCKPIYCRENQKPTKGLKRVTEFYERAIAEVQKLTNEDLAKKNAFKFLIDIDKEVHDKY